MHGEFHERFISAYKRKKCILQFYKFFENGKYFRIPREESHITVGKYLERLTFQTEFINLFEAIVKTTWQSKQKDLATFALERGGGRNSSLSQICEKLRGTPFFLATIPY